MSRSFKKTPKGGITTAKSEKKDKQLWHRSFRRVHRVKLNQSALETQGESFNMPVVREFHNMWSMSKDGKTWHGRFIKDNHVSIEERIRRFLSIMRK